MKLTTTKLKQIIKEELRKITEARYLSDLKGKPRDDDEDPDYGDTIPGLGYGKAPQDALEPKHPQGITDTDRQFMEDIILRMTPDELAGLMSKLDDETKKVLRRDFLGQSGGIPDPYDLER
jgi:hypothetical protein